MGNGMCIWLCHRYEFMTPFHHPFQESTLTTADPATVPRRDMKDDETIDA
jgi:hypothetical protein